MANRVLKDIKVEKVSNEESIITIQIFSDVPFLDKNFINTLLNPQEEKVNINPGNENNIINDVRNKMSEVTKQYDIVITEDMDEHEIFTTELSKEISKELGDSCIRAMIPTIHTLVEEINKVDKGGKTTPQELQLHLSNTIQLIDLVKSHMSYIPTLQQRDKMMFSTLDDIKNYLILGDKYLKLENFTNFWKLKEEMGIKNYNVGVKSRTQLPH